MARTELIDTIGLLDLDARNQGKIRQGHGADRSKDA